MFENGKRFNNQPDNYDRWMELGRQPSPEAKTAIEKQRDKQRGKLANVLLSGNIDKIAERDPQPMTERQRRTVIGKIQNGEITLGSAKKVLSGINAPIHTQGENNLNNSIQQSDLEWGIAAFMTGTGHNGLNSHCAKEFFERYPTPIDFEPVKRNYLHGIRATHDESEYREYTEAMRDLCRHIYGKRQDYYERFMELVYEAKHSKRVEQNHGVRPDQNQSNIQRILENERQYGDGVVKDIALVSRSRAEVTGNDTNNPNQDAVYIGRDGVYAIFDGVGGSRNGAAASHICQETMPSLYHYDFDNPKDREALVRDLNDRIQPGDSSTCVLAQITKNAGGGIRLNYISIGDSRLYLVRDGEAQQITRDDNITEKMLEGRNYSPKQKRSLLEHGISRYLGTKDFKGSSPGNSGSTMLQSGDRIVLCSDGITGDTKKDSMSKEDLAFAVSRASNCEQAAKNLDTIAKKSDDSSVIVFEV